MPVSSVHRCVYLLHISSCKLSIASRPPTACCAQEPPRQASLRRVALQHTDYV